MSLHGENQEDKTSHFINNGPNTLEDIDTKYINRKNSDYTNNEGVTIYDGTAYNENASYLLVRDGVAILRKRSTNSISGNDARIEKLQHILLYFLPVLCAVVLPLSALNIYLIVMQNSPIRPSYLLYANLLLSDILTITGGISLVVHFKTGSSASIWWFNNMIWLSFYTGVSILFGLVLIRIIAVQLGALKWLAYGYKLAKVVVTLSWVSGIFVTLLHDTITFSKIGSVVKDVAIIAVVVPTCLMNLYVWATLRRVSNRNRSFQQASRVALLLFLNFLFCYAYFTSCYLFYIYTVITGM